MERKGWLKEIRRINEERESLLAPRYDESWGEIFPLHRHFFERYLSLCPPQARLLDAACGTGKYWPLILASGRSVFGIDQSEGSLLRAREKFPQVSTQKIGLQEMDFEESFDGASCLDAMEMICPEDWPLVMHNLYRVIRPGAFFYFTVEFTREEELQASFTEGQQLGLPVAYGEAEWLEEGGYHWERGGCYHYYPKMEQVRELVQQAGFLVIEEQADDEYHHFLVKKE